MSGRWQTGSRAGCACWLPASTLVLLGDPGRAYLPSAGPRRARTLRRADKPRDRGPRIPRDGCLAGAALVESVSLDSPGNQSPRTCSSVYSSPSSRARTASIGSPCCPRSSAASSAAARICFVIIALASRLRLGLSSKTPSISDRASRIVARQPARGSAAGEASSFRRCRRIRVICERNSRRSDFPKLSISSARFSQSSGSSTFGRRTFGLPQRCRLLLGPAHEIFVVERLQLRHFLIALDQMMVLPILQRKLVNPSLTHPF